MRGGSEVNSDDSAFISQFEMEGEEQVRRNLAQGVYGARGIGVAADWLKKRSDARDRREREARLLTDRQIHLAESANQWGERQTLAAEKANQFAKKANLLSKWAIVLAIVGCVLALAALFK